MPRGWLWCLLPMLLLSQHDAAAAQNRWIRYASLTDRADSLQRAGASPAAFALVDTLLAQASRKNDRDLRIVATLGRARLLLNSGKPDEAEVAVRSVLADLESPHDGTGLCRAWRYLARADELRGQRDGARAEYERCLALARAEHLAAEEGWAMVGLAAMDQQAGRSPEAIAGYGQALARFESARERRGVTTALAGRAIALHGAGRTDEARRDYNRLIAEARREGDRLGEAQATGNLGSLEAASGDPAQAEAHLRAALEIFRALGMPDRALWASNALAFVYVNRDRREEADSVLTRALPDAERTRDLELRARVLSQMGVLRRVQRRYGEAIEYGRRAVAYSDSIPLAAALDVTYPLKGSYDKADRRAEALALLDAQIARFQGRLPPASLRHLQLARAVELRALGRPHEALGPLRQAALESSAVPGGNAGAQKLDDLAELARCYRDLAELDSALVWFAHVTNRWETWRGTTTDPGWREKYDDFARRYTGDYAATLLDPRRGARPEARAREAFDALQRFRARTLFERIHDPAATPDSTARVTSALELQSRVLLPGELFVDLHSLHDTTFAIVVTRDVIRAYGLPSANAIVPRLERLRALLSDPAAEGAALTAAASASLGTDLFGPAADLIARARRVVIAAGTLARFPLDQLVLPGESAALVLSREVTWVPSASLLAASRTPRAGEAARTMLAVAQSAPLDGVALPAAKREAEWLAQQFSGTDVLADASIRSAATVSARAGGYQVLHIAAHTRSGGRRPWQDAFRVGNSNREDAWLTAADIARLRLPARLCVMAGCRTVGSGAATGETLEGLATAWLAAGARTVLATRWEVDDTATSELMRRFYRRLSNGQDAGSALREAQLELRALPRYSHPYYWAGVQLIGEPETRVTLSSRRRYSPL